MKHISMTPFGAQPAKHAVIAARALNAAPVTLEHADRYDLLAELTQAKTAFGVSDRDLAVLSALVSFHPQRVLRADAMLIVFPSNAALALRAHGMAESTLRRHLAALVQAGLIARQDSPNGKRYAPRSADGSVRRAFGFDLRPLLVQGAAILSAAEAARQLAARIKARREDAVLMLRDIGKLSRLLPDDLEELEALRGEEAALLRALRRKLDLAQVERIVARGRALLDRIEARMGLRDTEETSGCDDQNERHIQSSDRILIERTAAVDKNPGSRLDAMRPGDRSSGREAGRPERPDDDPPPLGIVLEACPEMVAMAPERITCWGDLARVAETIRPMLGIGGDVWTRAKAGMGGQGAAITLACILQRFDRIRNPGAYLRVLSRKAMQGLFTPGPMLRALQSGPVARAQS